MRRVLLVDDEVAILRSTATLLRELGFDVSTHDSSTGILDAALAHRAEVLLQDVRMPGLDLDEHIAAIRARRDLDGLRVILFSASMDMAEVAERVGARWTLEKPFRALDLVATIEEACKSPVGLAPAA